MTSKFPMPLIRAALVSVCLAALATAAAAFEPGRPKVDRVFDDRKEAAIGRVAALPSPEAIEQLKGMEFLVEDEFMAKAIHRSFRGRKSEALDLSIRTLTLPRIETVNGREINRTREQYVARKIFEVFPEESIPRLLRLYEAGDAATRGNVIRAIGNVEGSAVTALLVDALGDKRFAEEEQPEVDGAPMRVCDLAYNQLVLRHRVKDVVRVVGPANRPENRDYHISMLRGRL